MSGSCALLYMPEHACKIQFSPSHLALHVQDGDALILIDVPDENFADAYGKILPSASSACSGLIRELLRAHRHVMITLSSYPSSQTIVWLRLDHSAEGFSCYARFAVGALKDRVDLKSIRTLIITHLTPKRTASLRAFLLARGGQGLSIHLSNPALQLLRSTFGEPWCNLLFSPLAYPCSSTQS